MFQEDIEFTAGWRKSRSGALRVECAGKKARSTRRTRRLKASGPDAEVRQAEQVRELTADIWCKLEEKLKVVRGLRDRHFDAGKLESYLWQARMYSKNTMKEVRRAWEEDGREETAYGALNALMSLAAHGGRISELQRTRLQRLAGVFAAHNSEICPHCMSVLRT